MKTEIIKATVEKSDLKFVCNACGQELRSQLDDEEGEVLIDPCNVCNSFLVDDIKDAIRDGKIML